LIQLYIALGTERAVARVPLLVWVAFLRIGWILDLVARTTIAGRRVELHAPRTFVLDRLAHEAERFARRFAVPIFAIRVVGHKVYHSRARAVLVFLHAPDLRRAEIEE